MDRLAKTITLPQGIGLLVATMMGTGVFVLPQLTALSAGNGALTAWLLLILAMLPVTWVFAKLGEGYPNAGGPSHIVAQAFGPAQGQVVGLMFLLLVPVGAPAAIEITMQFVHALVPVEGLQALALKLLFLVGLLALNWRGVNTSGHIQGLLTLAMVLVVVALLVGQLTEPYGATPRQVLHGAGAEPTYWPLVLAAAGVAFWSFMGIETMGHLSEEFKNPQRDFGRALMIGVAIVGLIYLACTWMILRVADGPVAGGGLVMIQVFDEQFGQGGRWVIGLLGVLSGAATVNVYVASVARLAYNLAGQGNLPGVFAHLNRHRVPTSALFAALSMIGVVLVVSHLVAIPYEELIRWTNGVFVLIYLLTMLAAGKLLADSHRIPVILGSLTCLVLAVSLAWDMGYALFLWTLLTVIVLRRRLVKSETLITS